MFARFCFPVSLNYIIFLLFMIMNLNKNLFNSKIHGIHSVIQIEIIMILKCFTICRSDAALKTIIMKFP